ncbi:LysR family transcriptional regulator [Collimonas sp. OK412]|jgi:DNA-binding transcriptional LysR family regulator|uniref:LysR family transcriptional regulator n=1 Tax=Collimonas sp. (strain OK412) TaxID=1801619 RepID=UPI0008EEC31A|nr:LysR family transcriptional regulator [Collimonas sp. OK412]SFC20541.1 DNA-binding transcriptional regulator, LysR family [Collimonas sp. OK412]
MNKPDLSELDAFACVARHRSFSKAALECGVSASALSHAIRTLETRLAVRLLNRTTRSVTPTEAGLQLLQRLEPALREIGEALERLNDFRDTPRGTLRLNVPRPAARLLLAPLFARFLAAYPQIRLEVVTDDGLVDIVAGGFDAGIRFGESLAQDMVALPLGPPVRLIVVASPMYAARRGLPRQPQELKQHACVGRRFPSGAVYAWEFSKDGEPLAIAVDGPLLLDDDELILRAALDGIGLAYVYEAQAQESIEQGRLLRVLDAWCPPMSGFFLYYPSRRQMPATLRLFIAMLRDSGYQ